MASQAQDQDLYYETHILCCCNQRAEGHPRSCCADRGGREFMEFIAKRIEEDGLDNVTVTEAGCMERCELGPTMVIYPDAVWYSYSDEADIEEIIESHLKGGERVERLVLEPDQKLPKPKPVELIETTVAEVANETPDIKGLVLKATNGRALPAFSAGAHIDVMTGNGLRRSYSIASDPADRSRYLLGVLREVESRGGSTWIHDEIKPGDTLKITKPLNNFPLADDATRHILIAGGIGVTPILAMARTLAAEGADFDFHYCTRSPELTAFRAEVEAIAGANLTYHHDGGDPSKGIELDRVLAEPTPGAHVYVCGPKGLIDAVRTTAGHWPEECVHFELFSAPEAAEWVNEPCQVYLSRRRMELEVPAHRTILEVVRDAGVEMDSSCEQGLCSTCQVRVISGEIEHRDQILTTADKARGDTMMICVSRGKPGEKLVLDI